MQIYLYIIFDDKYKSFSKFLDISYYYLYVTGEITNNPVLICTFVKNQNLTITVPAPADHKYLIYISFLSDNFTHI